MGRPPPRTWTPREPSPPPPPRDLPRYRPVTPPLPNEPSPTSPWTPKEDTRQYEEPPAQRPSLKIDGRSVQNRDEAHNLNRFVDPEIRNIVSLEKRLSEPWTERFPPETIRQTHALPPNPALHRGHNLLRSPEAQWKDERPDLGPVRTGWGDPRDNEDLPARAFDRGEANIHNSRPVRIRRPPGDRMDVDILSAHPSQYDAPPRPELARRGGSLLDRLSLTQNDDALVDGSSQSLRDRVQVPSKRDREEIRGDSDELHPMYRFEDDGYDPKKRRRSGKIRKVRRGGPP